MCMPLQMLIDLHSILLEMLCKFAVFLEFYVHFSHTTSEGHQLIQNICKLKKNKNKN